MAISPKVPMYKNSETICIPSPKYCLYTYVFKFMKQLILDIYDTQGPRKRGF